MGKRFVAIGFVLAKYKKDRIYKEIKAEEEKRSNRVEK